MIMLTDTRDIGIVENLQLRLLSSNIYTYIGHVLVVCNPYKWLSIYEKDIMKQYVHQVNHPHFTFITILTIFTTLTTLTPLTH